MTNFESVEQGDLMAVVMYATVKNRRRMGGSAIDCTNVDTKEEFSVQGASLVEKMFSADRYSEEKKVSKTEMAEVLSNSYNVPFTVTFEKLDGTQRKLRGRLLKPERLMGRCQVEDLDEPVGKRMRLVDNRTLLELIVDGIKYTLKK